MKVRGNHTMKFGGDARVPHELFHHRQLIGTSLSAELTMDCSQFGPAYRPDFAVFIWTAVERQLRSEHVRHDGIQMCLSSTRRLAREKQSTINLGVRFEHETPPANGCTVNGLNHGPSPIATAAIVAYATNPIPQIPVGQFQAPGA